ncbi:hypothetical protein [Asticcacaulis sp. EMRT-3]|uniref:hypothetical protein n=1 Tax=Asticcacaulis sp. EMRT-3 TaxID=3040349 RepID=UPI0024AF8701|nr:hypothetical protein [Asticcacaulis sp. EMRT-3]MDI7773853.1 hypothetical protein [Asticcacaulis sp. EMRT-3]
MDSKIFFPAAGLIALLLIAFSLVWPQGIGARSPAPFGHAIEMPDYYRMVRERDARQRQEAIQKAQDAKADAAASAAAASASAEDAKLQ